MGSPLKGDNIKVPKSRTPASSCIAQLRSPPGHREDHIIEVGVNVGKALIADIVTAVLMAIVLEAVAGILACGVRAAQS